ncbi:MAG: hypothetical protein ACXABI_03185 [Candidatus Hodarchaeales archaeon]|jgi:hypothetical protein
MAGIAHLGVGLASKRFTPKIHVIILIFGGYLIDIIFGIFMLAGLEQLPISESPALSPWSHGLFMAVVWSVLAGIITLKLSNNANTSMIFGLLVFTHWVIDFISHPMTFLAPDMTGLPLFFRGSPILGLGLWNSLINVLVGEALFLAVGVLFYIQFKSREKTIT